MALRAFGLSQRISDNYKENLAAQFNVDGITMEAATSTTEELQRVAWAMEAVAKPTVPVKVKHFNGKVEYLEDEKLAALCKEQKQLRAKLMGRTRQVTEDLRKKRNKMKRRIRHSLRTAGADPRATSG